MSGIAVILVFVVLAVIGVPIAFSMGAASILYFLVEGIPFSVFAQRIGNALNSFPLVAVPVFILAGNLMNVTGVTNRLFEFARMIVGRRKGGLAQVNVLASLIFSGISGAALADIGGLGNIEIKAMREQGYDPADAAAVTAASATVGPIFPPSIPLIIFATVAEASAVKLLLGGMIPAILITIALMIIVAIVARRRNFPPDTIKVTPRRLMRSLATSFPALLTPIILVGGLLSGWFGPTEVAAVTVGYAIVLGLLVYHELTWKSFLETVMDTVKSTATILFVVASASVFAWALTVEQIPAQMAHLLLSVSQSPYVLLLMINMLLIIVGMIVDTIAAILVMTPIIYPAAIAVGIDPIHLGIVVVFNLMIGLLTPPVGMSLYMVSVVAKQPVERVLRRLAPYLVALLVALLVVSFVPILSTWIPNLVFR